MYLRLLATAAAATGLMTTAPYAANPPVGGAEMLVNRNNLENALNSAEHTTLVAAVKAAGLVETLTGEGPHTLFAPDNTAFGALPFRSLEPLPRPENKAQLTKIVSSHVVAGDLSLAMIAARAQASSDGYYRFAAVSGATLSAKVRGGMVFIFDESGNAARVTIADVDQSNGVIQVVDAVLAPK